MKDKDAVSYAFLNGAGSTLADLTVGTVVEKAPKYLERLSESDSLPDVLKNGIKKYDEISGKFEEAYSKLPKTTQKLLNEVPKEAVSAGLAESMKSIADELLTKGFTQKQVEKILNYEVKKVGKSAANGAVQKVFYNAFRG